MKCDYCGKEFEPGNGPDGVPAGVSFKLQDGRLITMCARCICNPYIQNVIKAVMEGADNGRSD